MCQDEVRKARDQLELNLAWDFKDQKKGFSCYLGDSRRPVKMWAQQDGGPGYVGHGKGFRY